MNGIEHLFMYLKAVFFFCELFVYICYCYLYLLTFSFFTFICPPCMTDVNLFSGLCWKYFFPLFHLYFGFFFVIRVLFFHLYVITVYKTIVSGYQIIGRNIFPSIEEFTNIFFQYLHGCIIFTFEFLILLYGVKNWPNLIFFISLFSYTQSIFKKEKQSTVSTTAKRSARLRMKNCQLSLQTRRSVLLLTLPIAASSEVMGQKPDCNGFSNARKWESGKSKCRYVLMRS